MKYFYQTRKIPEEQLKSELLSKLRKEKNFDLSIDEWEKDLSFRAEKPEQIGMIGPNEKTGSECVQAFISNMTAPSTLKEMLRYGEESLPENILSDKENEWTVPSWAKAGDIVFFMHAKTANTKLTRLRTELNNTDSYSAAEREELRKRIDNHLKIHAQYGGKIFAIGHVCGGPIHITDEDLSNNIYHWRSRVYAHIDKVRKLKNPIDIKDLKPLKIEISRESAITPLFDEEFRSLRTLIGKNNRLPSYLVNCVARPIPLRKINKENWITVANDYRRAFILEKQYRKFYLDYLLRSIGDQKTFFTECRCSRPDIPDSFMDYVIRIGGKYLPVEAKLSVPAADPDKVRDQVSKYVFNTHIVLDPAKNRMISATDCHPGKVLAADTENLYMYTAANNSLVKIYDLKELQSPEDLPRLRQIVLNKPFCLSRQHLPFAHGGAYFPAPGR